MRRAALAGATLLALVACAGERTVERRDVTGVDLLVQYDPLAGLDQVHLAGTVGSTAGAQAFVPGVAPEEPRPLTSGADSVVLLLPDALAGTSLFLVVDGLTNGTAMLTGRTSVVLEDSLVDASVTLGPLPNPSAACDNGADDDGDGLTDSQDPGCVNASDDDERGSLVCDDGVDQDGDTFPDFPADPGCNNVNDASELGPNGRECDNGEDDDGDTFEDYPDDPQCADPLDNREDV